MTRQAPQVSVVLPTYNGGEHLAESVSSALSQSFGDLELIVVDDGSTDGSTDALPADPRLGLVRQPHSGVSAARNRGAKEAQAPLVAFLDADDRWLPEKLERQVETLRAHPDALLCYSAFAVIDPSGARLSATLGGEDCTYVSLFAYNPIPVPTVLMPRKVLLEAGGFDPCYSVGEDWDLWLRLALQGSFCCVPDCLVEVRVAPHNAGQASGSDPWLTCLQGFSVLGRHEIGALQTGDTAVLAAIRRARRQTRLECSARAAALFADSVGWPPRPNWAMARTAFRIRPFRGGVTIAHLLLRRARHDWLARSRPERSAESVARS